MKTRKLISLLLVLCLVCTALVLPTFAEEEVAVQTVRALGIMVGDQNGNLNLGNNVTRAEFTKMLVAASSERDTVRTEGTGYTVFSDVTGAHWASDYIRIAAKNGWMLGYTDGSFRPNNNIKLEEACTAVLRLVGYNSENLVGAFPVAQLNKAQDIGLRSQISLSRGQLMTRLDCARLFNNLMTAQTSTGKAYAATIGYTLSNGTVDISSAVQSMLAGPFVASADTTLPFTPKTVYRDGIVSANAQLSEYDVYYYNSRISTLWISTNRVSGSLSALTPNSAAPTSVTVAGGNYQLTGNAAYRLSSMTNDMIGKTVTLLLGINNEVVDVLSGAKVDATYYGVVQSCSKSATDTNNANLSTTVQMVCTDGVTRSFSVNRSADYENGCLVVATVTGDGTAVHRLTACSLEDTVSKDGKTFAGYTFAENIEILDTEKNGAAARITADRIAGYRLSKDNVIFYAFNEKGEISKLILRNATGEAWTFGVMTARNIASDRTTTSTYTVMVNGRESTYRTSGNVSSFSAGIGGCAICLSSDGSVSDIRQLTSVNLESLTSTMATAQSQQYPISDLVQVYLYKEKTYFQTDISAVNVDNFTLTGWYDNFGNAVGGKIRVIVAVPKP